jgi:hydrogenase maturation protease
MSCCEHAREGYECGGLALVAFGNVLRGDDGIAGLLCSGLPLALLDRLCYFDLGLKTQFLSEVVACHKSVLIVDATANGTTIGEILYLDLLPLVADKGKSALLRVTSTHGLSWLEELRLMGDLPESIQVLNFLGVEAASSEQGISAALEAQIPQLAIRLSGVVEELLRGSQMEVQ